MGTAYLFLADGFEEIEALTPVDILRRGEMEVKTVGITGEIVQGSHKIAVQADIDAKNGFTLPQDAGMLILPGGPGVANLKASEAVLAAVHEAAKRGIPIAAICAAPTLLCEQGLLQGKRATAYPACENEMQGCGAYTGSAVEVDGNIITGRSAGVAVQFAKTLLAALRGQDVADKVVQSIYPED